MRIMNSTTDTQARPSSGGFYLSSRFYTVATIGATSLLVYLLSQVLFPEGVTNGMSVAVSIAGMLASMAVTLTLVFAADYLQRAGTEALEAGIPNE
jgi:hypothetical protein